MEAFVSFLESIVKIISSRAYFLGKYYSHVGSMKIIDEEFTLFLFISENFDTSGVDLDLNLFFFATVIVAILSFIKFKLLTFRYLSTRNPISSCLFVFSLEFTARGFFYFLHLSLFLILKFRKCQLLSEPRLLRCC